MNFYLKLISFSLCIYAVKVHAQEVIVPLKTNPQLTNGNLPEKAVPGKHMKHGPPHVQELPYFDDFSRTYGYPEDTMWLDREVFINNTMGVNPPSIGVATFEGLNEKGRAYFPGNGTAGQPGDTLTSTYINLSPYSEADNIYLSFYYQPQGLGEAPESQDSLALEFKPDSFFDGTAWDSTKWVRVWSTPGTKLQPFRQVLIQLTNSTSANYFYEHFQFRFVAYANNSGNLDHWNVDYVLMDRGRSSSDTAINDVAVYYPSVSLLKSYYSMPWNHFVDDIGAYMRDSLPVFIRNNYNVTKNVGFGYVIRNTANNSELFSRFNTQGANIEPYEHRRFNLKTGLDNFPSQGDKVTLMVETSISSANFFPQNDTAFHKQVFDQYYAYDDGTAEAGYGIKAAKFAKVAIQFPISLPDTLRGIAIHFNEANESTAGNSFTLAVWDKISPTNTFEQDNPVREIKFQNPEYVDLMNGYYYYELAEPLPVQKQFFVGWIQNKDFFLNVGLDLNYTLINGDEPNNYLFYSITNQWTKSTVKGAPMIRPYFAKPPVTVGTNESRLKEGIRLNVYPNPSQGRFSVVLPAGESFDLYLMDMSGRQLGSLRHASGYQQLDYSALPEGMYLLKAVSTGTSAVSYGKIMIRK